MIIQCAADFHGSIAKYKKFFDAVKKAERRII